VREIETRVLDYEASRLDAILSEWIGGFAAHAAWTATGHQEVWVRNATIHHLITIRLPARHPKEAFRQADARTRLFLALREMQTRPNARIPPSSARHRRLKGLDRDKIIAALALSRNSVGAGRQTPTF
jgi:hypothetical protein